MLWCVVVVVCLPDEITVLVCVGYVDMGLCVFVLFLLFCDFV